MGSQGNAICQEDKLSGRQRPGSGNRKMRQDDDVRKTNGIRFKGINQQDLRKRLGCQQEWNKPGRLRTTPGAENTLQDVKIFTEKFIKITNLFYKVNHKENNIKN